MHPNEGENLLSDKQISDLSAPLTLPEMKNSLFMMKSGKAPEERDGLPKEFYCEFFEELGPLLLDVYHGSYQTGTLTCLHVVD